MENRDRSMSEENEFREEISNFLRRNFPQIQMHGGSSSILEADPDDGVVQVALGGACSGCGISPMTVQAIKTRMVDQISDVEQVEVSTGMEEASDVSGGFGHNSSPDLNSDEEDEEETTFDAPF